MSSPQMFQFSPGRSRAREQAHWVTEGSAALVMRTSTGEERSLDADLMEAIFWLMTNVDQSASVVVAGAEDRVSPSDAAKILGVSRPFVMNLVEEGQLPDFPVGAHHHDAGGLGDRPAGRVFRRHHRRGADAPD